MDIEAWYERWGNGIRLFSSLQELQAVFDEWEAFAEEDIEESDTDATGQVNGPHDKSLETAEHGAMTSHLRHFIAQPYIENPLLLTSYENRKFHIRAYVLSAGALKVYVYREMLALFAAKPYCPPTGREDTMDLSGHLTNTCFLDESTKPMSVYRFWDLEGRDNPPEWKANVFDQICQVTADVFEAAAKEQMTHFQAIPNAFEIFGVDFLVDQGLNVWLLELNAYPDFQQTGKDLQENVVGELFNEMVDVAIDPFFNSANNRQEETRRMRLVKDIDLGRR